LRADAEIEKALAGAKAKEVTDEVYAGSLNAWVSGILSNPTTRAAIDSGNVDLYNRSPIEKVLKDVGDGTRFTEKQWFAAHKNALAFIVYADDCTMNNGLAQKSNSVLVRRYFFMQFPNSCMVYVWYTTWYTGKSVWNHIFSSELHLHVIYMCRTVHVDRTYLFPSRTLRRS